MRGRTANRQDIDDRVQDVYVRLLQHDSRLLRNFDPKRASLATWLSLIARTIVHEHFQKRSLNALPLVDHDGVAGAAPPPVPNESITISLAMLSILSDQQRLVIQMLFEQHMTVEQAAHRLGVDPQTI